MKKTGILALAALFFAACSPQVYPLYLEVRQPSSSGLDLIRKNISIVYMDGAQPADSVFDRAVASDFARDLEADYFGGREMVGLYHIPRTDSVSLALMHNLVMETGGDVVFVLSSHLGDSAPSENQPVADATSVDSAYVCPVVVPVSTSLRVYDSMGEDRVLRYSGNAVLRPLVYNNGAASEESLQDRGKLGAAGKSEDIASRISRRFLSQWKVEPFSFYYYDSFDAGPWMDPLQLAADGKFAQAIDAWLPITRNGSAAKRAFSSYNIAQAFYLLDQYDMALRWLDYAESLENVSLAAGLRKRIAGSLE